MIRPATALGLTLVLAVTLSAADWPQWLGPRRDGGSAEVVVPWKEAPKEVWKAKVGIGFSSPVVANGKVFLHARVPGKEREVMTAFDAATGKELWKTAYDRAPYSSVLNTGPQATPAVAGGRVYGYGITGVLTCFEADTGKQVWQTDLLKTLGAGVPRFGVCCSPLVVGNRVVVATGGKGSSVVALDAATGAVAWQALDEPANTSSPVLVPAPGRPVPDVVFMTTLRVVGLNPLDGTVTWEYPLSFQPSGTAPTPVVAGDLIVTSTMDNGSTGIRLTTGEKAGAERAWQAKGLSGYFSSGVAAKDRLFLVTNVLRPVPRADLACVDLATGKQLWKKEGVGYFHFGLVRTGDGNLLVLDDAGNLKLLDAAAPDYRELATAKACEATLVAPALANGHVFARDGDTLTCLKLAP
ncbi:PQQ-like beta-propeller repeat protein [bacterium]|nr:PQQ-like beta-propeller repeat protein [bacterium]